MTECVSRSICYSTRQLIGRGYDDFWRSKQPYLVLKGSRASKKSVTTAYKIIVRMMQYPDANILVVRKVADTLRTSCYETLKWVIYRLGVQHLWKCKVSPLEMEYVPTGQKIYFRGMDDPQKIASINVSKGYLCWCWIEEAYEIKNEGDFDMLDESIRGYIPPETGLYKQMILTFNPWDKRHWIKARFFDIDDPNILAKTTNYMCNEWLDAADLAKFERMKVRNPRRFKVAGLGYWGIPEGLVYENWEVRSFDVSEIRQKQGVSSAFGLDFGYTTDPSALSAALVDQTERVIYVYDEMYERKMQNSAIYKWICSRGYAKERIIADSQEPKSIDQLRDLGLSRIAGAVKGPDSIMYGIQLVQDYKIIIHPRCTNTQTEIENYCWKTDRFGQQINEPEDSDNHILDALRYVIMDLNKKKSWRVG